MVWTAAKSGACIIIVSLLLSGCALWKTAPAAGKPADYFPSSPGNYWDYLGEGNEYASFLREVVRSAGRRSQFRENNGGTISASVYEITEDAVTRIHFQGETYEDVNLLNVKPTDPIVILKAPLKVGTKWGPPDQTREIISITETIDTPSGQFTDCLAVKVTFPQSTIIEYYKKGVGMVKRRFESEGFIVTSTLQEYHVKS